ncbi:MAG: hypothetical protein R6U91_05670 [Bacillota bacterium]
MRESFYPDVYFKPDTLTRALKGLVGADIFIAFVPGICSTSNELGMASTLARNFS